MILRSESDPNDWRRFGQEGFLSKSALIWRHHVSASPCNDQDHWEFCGVKFMTSDRYTELLSEECAALEGSRWTCKACLDDLRGRFGWRVQARE